jgi:hypothetical protein
MLLRIGADLHGLLHQVDAVGIVRWRAGRGVPGWSGDAALAGQVMMRAAALAVKSSGLCLQDDRRWQLVGFAFRGKAGGGRTLASVQGEGELPVDRRSDPGGKLS